MTETREFTELLKGCRPIKDENGNIIVQSIMNMQLVCLTTDKEYSLDDRFANPMDSLVASNNSYGEIRFQNNSNKEVITPTQMAVITKQIAQNHGMIKSGYISAKTTKVFNDAGCVQGAQGGHFRSVGGDEFRIIPITVREMLFESIGKLDGFSRIYPAIRKLGQQTNASTDEYLDRYFTKYDKKLEQFIAHFERPKNVIGVIILIDGEIVAIDKFPSFTYAEQIWDKMIRDCYGALAIVSELHGKKAKETFTDVYSKLSSNKDETPLEKLERALNKTKRDLTKSVEEKIQDLLELTLDAKLEEGNSSGPKSYVLKNEGYIGQVISESDFHHMVSIVRRESFNPLALRRVNELKKKARSQEKFSL